MNQAASHLASRRATKWKQVGARKLLMKEKKPGHLWGKRSERVVNM